MLSDNPRQLDKAYDDYITKWLDDLPEFGYDEDYDPEPFLGLFDKAKLHGLEE